MKFEERARWLYRIVLVQKTARTVLRAAWLGGAVYLFCWGVNKLWGVIPHSGLWILLALLTGFSTLLSILARPVSLIDFLWRVDARFSQKEQISTAYQALTEKEDNEQAGNSLVSLLIADAAALLPAIVRRVLDKGWRLRNDVEATIIVLMLLMIVYLSGMESFSTAIPGIGLGGLPGAGSDPTFLDIYSSGIPGDTSGSIGTLQLQQVGGESITERVGNFGFSPESLDLIYQVFSDMGTMLKDNAVTADFGSSLETGDLAGAADNLSSLSENLDRLSDPTRQNIADAFSYGARELYLTEFSDIRSPLESAATALEGGSQAEMKTELDLVSAMLRSFIIGQGTVYAREEIFEPESERVEGEGQIFELETPQDVSEFLVAPGRGEIDSDEVLSDTVDLFGVESTGAGSFSPTWYDYSWDDKNVVTRYFSPR